jgi:hypothetical protein
VLGLVEEREVTLAVARAVAKWSRAGEAWEAITWILCRDHEIGRAMTESGVTRAYTLPGARSIDWPTITVVYVIEAERIRIIDARFEEAQAAGVGRA